MVEDDNNKADSSADVVDFEDRLYSYTRAGPQRNTDSESAGDGLRDILETLYSEHRYLESLLDRLEQEAARLKPRRIPDYHLLLDIIDYLTHYPDQYHHPREDLLFSALAARDDDFKPLLARLEREHGSLHAYNRELFNELTEIASGRAVDRPRLLRTIENYVAGYRQHMEYESREVFPLAKGRLSAAERKKLGKKTRYLDDPLFGGEVRYQYRRLERSLRTRAQLASRDLAARELSAIQATIEKLSSAVDTAGRLKTVIEQQGRQSWREQQETIEAHTKPGHGPNIALLPLALLKGHRRHWREGIAEIRRVLSNSGGGEPAERRKQ